MDERLKMAAFAFLAAACTGAIWLMQAGGPRAASAAVDPLPEDQRIAQLVASEVSRQLPAAVEAEVKHQNDIMARKAQEKKEEQDELVRREAEKWAPAWQAHEDLQTLRSELALYELQHHDQWPSLTAMQGWKALLSTTDETGALVSKGAPTDPTDHGSLGPYLQAAPINLFNRKTTIMAAGHASSEAGWTYDEKTGALKVVIPTSELERAKPLNGDFEIGQ